MIAAPRGRYGLMFCAGGVRLLLAALGAVGLAAAAPSQASAPPDEASLDGEWSFALDPLRRGEEHGWHRAPEGWEGAKPLSLEGWDLVVTPHDYLSDPRYGWTGVAWYRRSFAAPKLNKDEVCRLCFDRVASKCEVWVNGVKAGAHVGGYSPFEIDITRQLKPGAHNHLAVKVDNSWEIGDIPGPRKGAEPSQQMYVWRNYGGLLRSTKMVVSPAVYVANQKVETTESQATDGVEVKTTVFLRNASSSERSVTVTAAVSELTESESGTTISEAAPVALVLPAGSEGTAVLTARLPRGTVRYWSVDTPVLYSSSATVSDEATRSECRHAAEFGVRSVRVANGSYLLNGEPVRLAGANRVEGHPKFGGLEPAELVELDLGMMKRAHFDLQRLQHYPPSEAMLDWADRNGMLIILEAPCWGLTPPELSDERYRENFRRQLIEMMQTSWNHPCVVGWSVGNEYYAWTPEGADWTKTFVDLAHRLDPTRPTTYAALGYDISQPAASKEGRGMHWVDFISVNLYTSGKGAGGALDKIHALWPEKPILISEYGKRTDQDSEAARIRHFRETLTAVGSRDYVMGLSYWSFNDYRSRYPGGDRTGHRPWGIVDAERNPRELYHAMQSALSPAMLSIVNESPLRVRVESRPDFPRMTLKGYRLEVLDVAGAVVHSVALPELLPGSSRDVDCGAQAAASIRLVRPTGFVSVEVAPHTTNSKSNSAR